MSRPFLAPIKHPTWKDFFVRVGGAFAVILLAILTAKAFFPGYEAASVLVVATILGATAVIQAVRHSLSKRKAKNRRGTK
jgi:hypothetical protein